MGRTVGGGLRSRLLVGVAAAAMAAPVANRALAADPGGAKFSPYVEAGGMVGTHSFGDVDIFIPVWQDQTSILFGDLRGTFSAQPTEEGNFGLGYRTQVSPEWILGGYGYFDIANSPNNNLFYQITLGVELKSVDWDFRLNGYIPINPDGGSVTKNGNANIKISGNTIQMTTESRDEKALYGFDGEVGWRVPVFPADGDFDLRVYAGGYYFTNGDVDTIAGPRGRIEARLYDIDFLGLQSRLTAQGVIQWDAPRGTQGWGGLELRIPLGAITGSPGPKLNPLDRRMVDRVVRDIDIVTEKTTPKKTSEDVIVDELTVSTHTIVFANSNGAGSGAQGSPIDLNQAPSRGQTLGSNAIILADGGNGNIAISNPLQLSNGQALIGGGSIVPLTGAKTGKTVDFKFSGSRPTLVGTNPNENVVDMATGSGPTLLTQNEVWGVNITGQFSNGIFGQNMERAIVKHSNIDAGGSIDGEAGIYIAQYGDGTQKSSFVHIANNTVSNSPDDGIDVGNSFSDGASHTQTVIISYNTVVANLHDGIDQRNVLSGTGTTFTQGLAINNNVATANGVAGIETRNFVSSGAVLVQALQIDPNTVAYNAYAGIRVGNFAFSGGVITQGVVIADNTVRHNGFYAFIDHKFIGLNQGGIVVDNNASNGSITQALAIDGNSVAWNGAREPVLSVLPAAPPFFNGSGNGISVYNRAVSNASILQVGEISGNQIDHNSQNGIGLANEVSSGSVITQQLTIAGNSITFNHSDGIFNKNFGFLGTLDQTLSIDNDVISHNGESGIFVSNGFAFSTVNQNITIDPTTITDHPYGFGIAIFSHQFSGTTVQNIAVLNSTITDSRFEGVIVETGGSQDASITQNVTISGNSISDSGSHGVEVEAGGRYGVHVVQNTTITGNAIDHSGRAGVAVFAYASSRSVDQSGSLTQNVLISGNSVDHSSSSGIYVDFHAVSIGDAMHTVTVANNIVTNSREDGIKVVAGFSSVANPVASTISITGNQVSNVSRYAGIFVSVALSSASVVQSVVIDGNSVAHAHSAGIYLSTFVEHDSTLTQTAQITNNAVYDIHDGGSVAGIFVSNFVSNDSTFSQSLTIAGNQIATLNAAPLLGNVAIGIGVNNFVGSNATLDQTAAIDNNTVSDLHGQFVVGIGVYSKVSGLGASLSQVLTIDPNTITGLHGITGNGEGYAVGIGVFTRVDYHGVATQTVTIADNVISHVSAGAVIDEFVSDAATGILVTNTVGSNSTLSQTAFIDSNTISELRGASAVGIVVYSEVSGGGAFMTQALTIDPNTITGLHGTTNILGGGYAAGIGVFTRVVSGGFASQTVAITDNSISNINAGHVASGVYVASHESDGTLLGSLDIVDNAVSGISGGTVGLGINVFNRDASFGTFSQSVDIAGNVVSGVSGGIVAVGIGVANRATSSTMSQTVSITGNFVSGVVAGDFAVGIAVNNEVGSGGTINQNVAIANNTVTYTGDGIYVFSAARSANSSISQAITITGNAISDNFEDGIDIVAHANSNSTITQGGTIASNSVTFNGFDGIAFRTSAEDGIPATTNQTFDLTNNTVSNNGRHGIYLYASGIGATQVVTLTTSAPGNVITNNGGWGVALRNSTLNTHQTFAAHSTQIGGTGPNILSPNNLGAYHLSGVGTQVFTKN